MIILKEKKRRGAAIYAANYYYMELNTAKMLHDLNVRFEESDAAVSRRLAQIEKNMDIPLDSMQRTAVIEAAKNGLLF